MKDRGHEVASEKSHCIAQQEADGHGDIQREKNGQNGGLYDGITWSRLRMDTRDSESLDRRTDGGVFDVDLSSRMIRGKTRV